MRLASVRGQHQCLVSASLVSSLLDNWHARSLELSLHACVATTTRLSPTPLGLGQPACRPGPHPHALAFVGSTRVRTTRLVTSTALARSSAHAAPCTMAACTGHYVWPGLLAASKAAGLTDRVRASHDMQCDVCGPLCFLQFINKFGPVRYSQLVLKRIKRGLLQPICTQCVHLIPFGTEAGARP